MSDDNMPGEQKDNTSDDDQTPEARVLVVGKSQYNIQQVTAFLTEKGLKATGVYSLKTAIPALARLSPTHVFVSVAFGTSKVNHFANTFGAMTGAVFYVFPEETTTEADHQIRASIIDHKMNVNITGGGVLRIVDAWVKEEWLKTPGLRKKNKRNPYGAKKIRTNEEDPKSIGSVMVVGGERQTEAGNVTYLGGEGFQHEYKAPAERGTNLFGIRIGLAQLKSAHFEGYAIFSTDLEFPVKPRQIHELTEELATKLIGYFESQEREVPAELDLVISKLEISYETEQFIEYLDSDTGVKFIEGIDPIPHIDPSTDSDMICIDLERIDTEHPVTFDVYIRLSMNKKYVKYIHIGDTLNVSQKEKLLDKKTDKVHIKKEDRNKFENYCTYTFLRKILKNAS